MNLPTPTLLRLGAATLAIAALTAGCSKGSDPGQSAPPAAVDVTTPALDESTDVAPAASTGKVTGANLLSWDDYSSLGIKGLTVRYSSKAGKGALSRCEQVDLRGVGDRTAVWQSVSETSTPGRALPNQQIASFKPGSGADDAMASLQAWNRDCQFAAVKHSELELGGGTTAAYWLRDIDDKASELVVLVHVAERVSYTAIVGPKDALTKVDAQAVAEKTAQRLA